MFFDENKKRAMTIVSKRPMKGGPHSMEPTPMKAQIMKDEGGEIDPKHLAAQDILAAHHAANPDSLNEALGNYIDLHLTSTKKDDE
jgi:hypothetical protein